MHRMGAAAFPEPQKGSYPWRTTSAHLSSQVIGRTGVCIHSWKNHPRALGRFPALRECILLHAPSGHLEGGHGMGAWGSAAGPNPQWKGSSCRKHPSPVYNLVPCSTQLPDGSPWLVIREPLLSLLPSSLEGGQKSRRLWDTQCSQHSKEVTTFSVGGKRSSWLEKGEFSCGRANFLPQESL